MPEPEGLVVKNGTKILSCTSGRMPSPLSLTVIRHCHERAGSIFTSIRGCSFLLHASLAFLIRLISTCSICVRSIWSMRSVSGSSIRIYSSENSFCKSCNSSRTATGRRTGGGKSCQLPVILHKLQQPLTTAVDSLHSLPHDGIVLFRHFPLAQGLSLIHI